MSAPTADTALPARPRHVRRRTTLSDFVIQWILPLVAVGLLAYAAWFVWFTRPKISDPSPPITPATSPYTDTLAAAGVVEARTENIAVGSATAGIVVAVDVTVGDQVEAGAPLFRIDDRKLAADLVVKQAQLSERKAELVRLEAEPREEEIPLKVATVKECRAELTEAQDLLRRAEETFAKKVTTEQELTLRREAVVVAQARLDRAQADLDLLEAGSWQYDRDVAAAGIVRAEKEVEAIQTELDRLVVRALVSGRVLQVHVRPGEYVAAPSQEPLIILGDTQRLHVRVDVDEYDIARLAPGAKATASPRGNLSQRYPLDFVRIEPFVVPKKSLTGDSTERVDTRVLQVIYEFDPSGLPPLFVGQQVEVFIEAVPITAPIPAPGDGG